MRRRAFLGRLARGVAALYVTPGAIEALASSAPVQARYLESVRFEEITRMIHEIYLRSVVDQVRRESPIAALFRDAASKSDSQSTITFPVRIR